ncbi:MAG: hypothetical protein K5871_07855 [Lachnospiraceae bacterium]|nr:hypothetical protein [Lachnospiraceae bacterium]
MIDLFSISPYLKGIVGLIVMLLYLADIYILLQALRINAGWIHITVSSLSMIGAFVLFQFTIPKRPYPVTDLRIVITAFAALSVVSAFEYVKVTGLKKNRLSEISIKEGLDHLPAGICFYNESGMPMLTNHRMNLICLKLTRRTLSDAKTFWDSLSGAVFPESINGSDDPIVCIDGEGTFSFKRYSSETDGETTYELIASDISDEYAKTKELEEKNRRISKINERLKALNNTIRYMIMEKETLQLKVRLHDNLGQALILGRQFARDPGKADKDELIRLWKNNLLLLKNEERETWQVPYSVNIRRAEMLGVQISVDGTLPLDKDLIPVIDTAIAVHTTNVSRHAEGKHAYIKVEETDGRYRIRFTNDGTAPDEEIQEHGGLANLRDQVKMAGGTMSICSSPAFCMELDLPKETNE